MALLSAAQPRDCINELLRKRLKTDLITEPTFLHYYAIYPRLNTIQQQDKQISWQPLWHYFLANHWYRCLFARLREAWKAWKCGIKSEFLNFHLIKKRGKGSGMQIQNQKQVWFLLIFHISRNASLHGRGNEWIVVGVWREISDFWSRRTRKRP